jgi:hypothetical protein
MKPTRNSPDTEKLAWFLALLNAGREPETPVGDRRKPEQKKNRPALEQPLPERLRSDVGIVMGEIVSLLGEVNGPLNESGRRALRSLAASRLTYIDGSTVRVTTKAEGLHLANLLAQKCLSFPHFGVDRSGKLRVSRVAPPQADAAIPLMIDAMNELAYLVDHGLHSRLKCCPGYREPLYRGAPRRRCCLWFDGPSNALYHSIDCRKRVDREKHRATYNKTQVKNMRAIREEERKADEERRSKFGEWKRPPVRRSPKSRLKSSSK